MAFSCSDKTSDKKVANCSRYFTALQCINNLEAKRSYKRKVNFKNINYIILQFDNEDQNVYKTANKSASIQTNETLLSSNRLELSK